MQKYVAIESAKPSRGSYSFSIYHVVKNNLHFIEFGSINYASTRGAESEVMNRLIDLGYIPKKYHGYYTRSMKRTFEIDYIVPRNQ